MCGYLFDKSIQINMFPKNSFQSKNIIICPNNTNNINSSLDKYFLGIDMLTKRYNIESDLFF